MTEADGFADHAASPELAQPDATSDGGEELGRLGRILAIPLLPFVALWEAANGGLRAISSGARWLRSIGVSLGRFLRRLLRTAGRRIVAPLRAGYEVAMRVGRRARSAADRVWAAAAASALPFGRLIAATAAAVNRPVRAVARGVASLARRLGVALRAAARAVSMPIRTVAGAVAALVKRTFVAMRALATSVAAGLRAAGRAVLALVRRLGVALRSLAQLFTAPLRFVGRTLADALRAAGRLVMRPIRTIGSFLLASARQVARLLTVSGRRVRDVCLMVARLLAAPFVGAVRLLRACARSTAAGVRSVGEVLLRFGRRIWRPVASVGRHTRERSTLAFESVRKARRIVGTRLRSVAVAARSKSGSQWRHSGAAARRVFRDARVGVRRSVSAAHRGRADRSSRSFVELAPTSQANEIAVTVESDLPTIEVPASIPSGNEPARCPASTRMYR